MSDNAPSCRILLVEDEAMIAMLVEDMLEDLGHELVRVAPASRRRVPPLGMRPLTWRSSTSTWAAP
jgi:CheY-like chemotaxis protein